MSLKLANSFHHATPQDAAASFDRIMKRSSHKFDIQGTLGRGTFGMVFTVKGTASSEDGVFALKVP